MIGACTKQHMVFGLLKPNDFQLPSARKNNNRETHVQGATDIICGFDLNVTKFSARSLVYVSAKCLQVA